MTYPVKPIAPAMALTQRNNSTIIFQRWIGYLRL